VRLAGNVFQPGLYQWSVGMRLSDLLPAPDLVKPMSDLNYVLIRREVASNVDIDVTSADLAGIWARALGVDDVALEPRDTVHVFSLESGRQHIIQPILEELQAQAEPNEAIPLVRVGGQVRAEGEYPLEPGMQLSDLLRAGGGLSEAAYPIDAELTRYTVVNGEYRETEVMNVNLAAVLQGNSDADLLVAPYDYLIVKEVPRWRGEDSVTLRGEVVFPGDYPIRQGETLSSVLARAGGVTGQAFAEGSVFTRVELREREREQIEVLVRRIQTDLASLSLSDPTVSDAISTGQSLVTQLRNAVPIGRLAIRLDRLLGGIAGSDILLRDGDELFVPKFSQEVTVLGEVQYATSHVFERGLGRDDYIRRSGGLTRRADDKRIYIVRANGEVVADSGPRWFRRDSGAEVRPGDTIVVPLDVDRVRPLARWSAVTQVVYNLAIAAAAVNSF
jgi:protein involved in polysaccharide export with SLBB domain